MIGTVLIVIVTGICAGFLFSAERIRRETNICNDYRSRKPTMKPCVQTCRLRLLLLLAAAFLITITTAFAQETAKSNGCSQRDTTESLETTGSCKDTAAPVENKKNLELLNELQQPDSSLLSELTRKTDQPTDQERTQPPPGRTAPISHM